MQFFAFLRDQPSAYRLVWVDILGRLADKPEIIFMVGRSADALKQSTDTVERAIQAGQAFWGAELVINKTKEGDYIIAYDNEKFLLSDSWADEETIRTVRNQRKKKAITVGEYHGVIQDIFAYWNQVTGQKLKGNNKGHLEVINARLQEGFQLEDFKKVIDMKYQKWKGTDKQDYIRPETLFTRKMESYLNENTQSNGAKSGANAEKPTRFNDYANVASEVSGFNWEAHNDRRRTANPVGGLGQANPGIPRQ